MPEHFRAEDQIQSFVSLTTCTGATYSEVIENNGYSRVGLTIALLNRKDTRKVYVVLGGSDE